MSRPQVQARTRPSLLLSILAVAVCLSSLVGCGKYDEMKARRAVNEGNAEYGEQNYDKAAKKFEEAIKDVPDLEIAHHNLGITYSRMFKAGVETPENKAIADKATEQLGWWLAKHPDDLKIRKLITTLWLDAGEYEKALAFWKNEHTRDPKARDVLQTVAAIYMKSQDWRSAIEWYRKDVEAAPDAASKVAALNTIASNVALGKLFAGRGKLFGAERAELAEIGLQAAEEGIKLDPKVISLWNTSQGLWDQRSLGNGQSWAYLIDRTESQVYSQRARVLREEAKKANPPAAPGTPAAPGNGT